MEIVLQKSKQAKTRLNFKTKKSRTKNGIVSFSVIRTLKLEAVTTSPRNRSLEQKVISALFIVFENFFKITLVYACLLLWNTNAISRISIKNSITHPKNSHRHLLTGILMYLSISNFEHVLVVFHFLKGHTSILASIAKMERKLTLCQKRQRGSEMCH